MDVSDAELLQAWRDGDERAGRQLFERHFTSVFRFFRSKIEEAAEDLTQQTFMGCLKGKDRFRGDSSFRTYLFTIARNRLYTYLRDRQRRDNVIEFGTMSVADLGAASPTRVVAAKAEQRVLLKALRRLPVEMQVAMELHYWEDMSVREIAVITDTPEGTIKRRLQRGRTRLNELIAELSEDEAIARSTVDNFADWAQALRQQMGVVDDSE
jgi:RNA polymerase sigma-70 factor (ECF subfamily)